VNRPDIDLSMIPGPAHSDDFNRPKPLTPQKEINQQEQPGAPKS